MLMKYQFVLKVWDNNNNNNNNIIIIIIIPTRKHILLCDIFRSAPLP
jgi:hypothetical protein